MSKFKIFIGFNEKMLFDSIALIFAETNSFEVVGGITNPLPEISLKNNPFDLLIIELGVPNRSTIDYINTIQAQLHDQPILLLSSHIKNRIVSDIIDTGINGYLLKTCNKEDLVDAATKVINGSMYFCHKITKLLLNDYKTALNEDNHILTRREIEILKMLVHGDTNYLIAENLRISETTVKTHRKNLMLKLGAKNIFSLIRYACRHNIIEKGTSDFCDGCPCAEHF